MLRERDGANPAKRVSAKQDGGDRGIRTLDRALQPYNGLANRRLQPLGHISVGPRYARPGAAPQASLARVGYFGGVIPVQPRSRHLYQVPYIKTSVRQGALRHESAGQGILIPTGGRGLSVGVPPIVAWRLGDGPEFHF